ncbi:MAG: Rne/Rng family ribonuclease [Sphingomonadaceae bacterium]
MATRMLIDARHPEETRVAVIKGNRIEEFDFESAEHKQLKGNIYLAKVTRVEPSLQAAFVDYGGNRHGFLAFSEIHPDYYQIPKEDREALLAAEAEHAAEEAELRAAEEEGDVEEVAAAGEESEDKDSDGVDEASSESLREKRRALRRRYKIQDVIKRRQVLLVQVVKEERGNKGAALTTYLSLAGRYCVLMPNTAHGGGISRKISNGADRKRLKKILSELKLPPTMGCIVRTAGVTRTKTEIKRDFDYLARLWDEIREKTLKSSAPSLIYGDSDLIKRAIRDIYNRDIEEVLVEGEEGYKSARAFMKLLMPSHVRRVKAYEEPKPLFQKQGVEDQLTGMFQPMVQLKSGGYLVINPTEALVSIDINSGRSTREHNIEQTALATNLEAAGEIARQLRLRDMAGLIVIDFIDMESNGHVKKVEKAMKEALKGDRARIQLGRISSFGLMEMSRQRLRTGVLEASTRPCPHCEGTGLMRTAASSGLSALRMIEEEAARGRGNHILLHAGREAAVYLLNRKRSEIAAIEERYGVEIEVAIDESLQGAQMSAESMGPRPTGRPAPRTPAVDEEEKEEEDFSDKAQAAGEEKDEDEAPRSRKRRRRGRRGGRRRSKARPDGMAQAEAREEEDGEEKRPPKGGPDADEADEPEKPKKARRRPGARKPASKGDEEQEKQAKKPADPGEEAPSGRASSKKAAAKKGGKRKQQPGNGAGTGDGAKESGEAPAKPEQPVLAREQAGSAGVETGEPGSDRSAPARRGWWQRTFGG